MEINVTALECLDPDELPPSPPFLLLVTVLGQSPSAVLLLSGLPTDTGVQDGTVRELDPRCKGRGQL